MPYLESARIAINLLLAQGGGSPGAPAAAAAAGVGPWWLLLVFFAIGLAIALWIGLAFAKAHQTYGAREQKTFYLESLAALLTGTIAGVVNGLIEQSVSAGGVAFGVYVGGVALGLIVLFVLYIAGVERLMGGVEPRRALARDHFQRAAGEASDFECFALVSAFGFDAAAGITGLVRADVETKFARGAAEAERLKADPRVGDQGLFVALQVAVGTPIDEVATLTRLSKSRVAELYGQAMRVLGDGDGGGGGEDDGGAGGG